jgi:NADH-quinone oxidoreductase subunit L
MDIIAIVGAFTAIFAASIGLVLNDIKRVIAYSTISQLGYMMLALGIGAYPVAIFHLFTHAFFKSLLFLGSGSVQHASGTFNMQFMGGLRRYQPWTYGTFLVAGLSLAGIFPLAGFWSKDEILAEAFSKGDGISLLVFALALVTVFMTSFYIFRVIFLTFHGEFRGGIESEIASRETPSSKLNGKSGLEPNVASHGGVHLKESPLVMVLPMLLLGILAAVAGFLANPPVDFLGIPAHWITHYLTPPGGGFESPSVNLGLISVSTIVAVSGIALSWFCYRGVVPVPQSNVFRKITILLQNQYYIDHLYEGLFANRLFYQIGCRALNWFDRAIVDDVIEKIGWIGRNIGRAIRLFQTGQIQSYATGITVGVLIIFLVIYFRG